MPRRPNPSRADATVLLELIERLRGKGGCPWDQAQTLADVRGYLIEEAHEAAEALDRSNFADLEEELGDLLFQVCFVAILAEEQGHFQFGSVIERVRQKMVARHPHVFGEALPQGKPTTPGEVKEQWERIKQKERENDSPGKHASVLDSLPRSLPALTTALRLSERAARTGFDWPEFHSVREKLDEELLELDQELTRTPREQERIQDELGDLLFVIANLGRHLGVDPEVALAQTNQKFRRRFQYVERNTRSQASLEVMEALWEEAKELESQNLESSGALED